MIAYIKKTSEKAVTPKKGSPHSAGFDLYSIEESATLQYSERKLFKTGIHIQIPHGYYGRIAPRSGLAFKQGIDVMAGVIDSDYTGEVGVLLVNTGNMPTTVDTTKAIAQLIIEKHHDVVFEQVNELDVTERGIGGFGHTDSPKTPSIEELYNKAGGIPVREKYTEELKKREQE